MSISSRLIGRLAFNRFLSSTACGSNQEERRDYGRGGRQKRQEEKRDEHTYRNERNEWWWASRAGGSTLALSWLVTLKEFFGMQPMQLDKDPLKDKIKQSWLQRKHGAYDEAIIILHTALDEANKGNDPMAVTRITDELANTYYEKGDWAEAESCFRNAIQRLVQLHGLKDSEPVFIGISLKLADLLAKRGELDNAETGFTHCLRKQMKCVDAHLAKNSVARGAMAEERHPVDRRGAAHSDPLALFGMCLDGMARFLVEYRDESRLGEADEYMAEVLKISYQIYGSSSAHTVHMASNFGTLCILKNRFTLALKYLTLAVDRAVHIDECAPLLPSLYCSYSEALFHCNKKEQALEYARRALSLTRASDEKTKKYVLNFIYDLERDMGRRKRFYFF